jgi:D-alanyl-D-alanine dipeptidase
MHALLLLSMLATFTLDDTGARQLVVVETPDWAATKGTLTRFTREGTAWKQVGKPIAVVVGKGGLGWGVGLDPLEGRSGPEKVEGDGRAPAGVFRLTSLFGVEPAGPDGASLRYTQATEAWHCVDDITSYQYNHLVDATDMPPKLPWTTSEKLRRKDALYDIAVVVDHNHMAEGKPLPGKGSCIFLHVWRAPTKPTVGCTAMVKPEALALAAWLDAAKQPVLVQLPKSELSARRAAWKLPAP